MTDEKINTGGGGVVKGDVDIDGGDFTGRDKINATHHNTRNENTFHTNLSGNTIVTVLAVLIVGAIAFLVIFTDRILESQVVQSNAAVFTPSANQKELVASTDTVTFENTRIQAESTLAEINTPQLTPALPRYPDCLLIGKWESQDPNDRNVLEIVWDSSSLLFKGTFIVVGKNSRNVGTVEGDYVYEAVPTDKIGVLSERSRWVYGSNGVAVRFDWRSNTVDVNAWPSHNQGIFYNGGLQVRAADSPITNCSPNE